MAPTIDLSTMVSGATRWMDAAGLRRHVEPPPRPGDWLLVSCWVGGSDYKGGIARCKSSDT